MTFFIQCELSNSILNLINNYGMYYLSQLNLYHITLFCHISDLQIFFQCIFYHFVFLQGVMLTVKGSEEYDFVSRYFAPWVGIPEDPVTGTEMNKDYC